MSFRKGVLISEFEDRSVQDHGSGWSNLWDTGKSDLWDRGKPSPALIDIIENYSRSEDILHPFTPDGRRKKALVPGCGRGYEVVMLSLHGFDAYGLEVSATAVAEAKAYATKELTAPQAYNFGHGPKIGDWPPTHSADRGVVEFLQGDFFATDWSHNDMKFDLVYDYTFLCALHPTRRAAWAERMMSLLNPRGVLVCLEFPMYKDPSLPGPPWGVKGVYWDLLSSRGITGSGECTRLLYIQPQRTHEIGMGTDMISVYARNE
ncbi:thiopurine S-methyltransferase family protein [Aspergillus campestris IBT 28561]|uniref:Thiopurine S-methyltransferase family protein n=1 Tax=Aspergillus campestris (strain IBT 28561) TaxID=1392248 RepID=A0A2I1CTL9_ASPC2|nr:thiopurine S-methyltransferase family protein [Aspergillus campestris IBT 28561]PKY00968.1 thiopurine S-methyltransferase family protein [Aspergillus campestris IBT 28561]